MLAVEEAFVPSVPEKRVKNRAQTESAILQAARNLLAQEGFQGFGINAIARRAGCDKQLIYRYYGGLDGLLDAIGTDLGDWVKERIPEDTGGMFLLTYGDLMERLALLYMEALRRDQLVCKIIAWEVSKDTPQVRRLAEARSRALAKWLARMGGSLSAPKGVDAPTLNGILFAAIQHLVISSVTTGEFAGLPLRNEKDWDKVAASVRRLVRGVYG